jgi:hypothetical protein
MNYANFLLILLMSMNVWSQDKSCDQIFENSTRSNVLYMPYHSAEVWLDLETVFIVKTTAHNHRPQFQLRAELIVPQQSLLQALLDVVNPARYSTNNSSKASYGLEILPKDTYRWFDQMGLLQAISLIYPKSTTIHISTLEVIPEPSLQKLVVRVGFSLVDHSKTPEDIDLLYLKLMEILDTPRKKLNPFLFWKKQPKLGLGSFCDQYPISIFFKFSKGSWAKLWFTENWSSYFTTL